MEVTMRSRMSWVGCLVVLVLPLVAAGEVAGQGTDARRLPAAIEKAVKVRWPDAEILGFKVKQKAGGSQWKIDLEDSQRAWQAAYADSGALLGTEEIVEASSLPGPVRLAVEKKFPGGVITEAKRETTGDGESPKITYEVETTKGQATVDPQGTVLKVK
jgi:hypothetical protein